MHWLSILHFFSLHGTIFASLISLQTLQDALNVLGYPAVVLFIMIESMGVPFPGETMLLLASFYAGVDHHLQIPIVIACAALGAIVGDNLGYYIGRTGGRALIQRFGRYIFLKPAHLDYAEKFFAKHGNKTVFFGRFTAILRTWAAFFAGVNRMRWQTFLAYNAAGGILWAIFYGTLGYLAGRFLHDNFSQVERIASTLGWAGVGIVVAVVVIAFVLFRVRRARQARNLAKTAEEAKVQEEKHIPVP